VFDDLFRPDPEAVLSVTALTRQIKSQLEGRFRQVWVRGEVSNLRRQSSGHVYFSLKDAGSQLPCVLFARDAAAHDFQPENGMELMLMGDLSVYEPHGRYQLIAKLALRGGQGRLHLEFERLKRKLAAEGLFDRERKKPLPALPQRIALITSPSGAAVRDFLRILNRREFAGEVLLFPARVQGAGAAGEIAAMLAMAESSRPGFDAIVLTRGGGSIEDLWPFNEEGLARAVAACATPVVSAVGHEIDTVLTDYAADLRAETPSAAAELLSSLYLEALDRLSLASRNLEGLALNRIQECRQNIGELHSRLRLIAPDRQIALRGMRLDEFEGKLARALNTKIARSSKTLGQRAERLQRLHPAERVRSARTSLEATKQRLTRGVAVQREQRRKHLGHLAHRLENGSLASGLRRGFAVLKDAEGGVLDRAAKARRARRIVASLHDGELRLKPDETPS